MKDHNKSAYQELLKIASALDNLERIQEEVGKSHAHTDEKDSAPYEHVERRLMQPYSDVSAWYDKQSVTPKVEAADELDDMPEGYSDKMAKGLNNRFYYPHSKEFKKSAGYIRKSSFNKLKKAGLN